MQQPRDRKGSVDSPQSVLVTDVVNYTLVSGVMKEMKWPARSHTHTHTHNGSNHAQAQTVKCSKVLQHYPQLHSSLSPQAIRVLQILHGRKQTLVVQQNLNYKPRDMKKSSGITLKCPCVTDDGLQCGRSQVQDRLDALQIKWQASLQQLKSVNVTWARTVALTRT